MSLSGFILDLLAARLKHRRKLESRRNPAAPRILVIRRNRMGDMIYTLPLLQALRSHFPTAHITVACDRLGEPIARSCAAVNEVVLLEPGWNRWLALFDNAGRLQDFDCVIAAKGGFDLRLAVLARWTNAARRIGFEWKSGDARNYFTDVVSMPDEPYKEHQVETLLRLVRPLGFEPPEFALSSLELTLPETSLNFAQDVLAKPPFAGRAEFGLMNMSCNRAVKFTREDYAALIRRLIQSTDLRVGIVSAPEDRADAQALAREFSPERVVAVATPGPLELAALLKKALFFLTPGGGAGHLSAATDTPTVVLWSEPYGKWRPRGRRHVLVEATGTEARIPVERVWTALVDNFLQSLVKS
jgi:ADP-heptose:LPS heptosyltransferase